MTSDNSSINAKSLGSLRENNPWRVCVARGQDCGESETGGSLSSGRDRQPYRVKSKSQKELELKFTSTYVFVMRVGNSFGDRCNKNC